MIRHVALFTWTEDMTEEMEQQFAAELRAMAATLPGLKAYNAGPDVGITRATSTSPWLPTSTTQTATPAIATAPSTRTSSGGSVDRTPSRALPFSMRSDPLAGSGGAGLTRIRTPLRQAPLGRAR